MKPPNEIRRSCGVFAERLKQATTLLGSAVWAHGSITDIAFACGFNDVSRFGRVFAAEMQLTPSQYRVRSQVT